MPTILTLTMNPCIDKSTAADHVLPERKLRCRPPRHEPGGGGINVSRAIHRLGGKSLALYPAGGYHGKVLRELLDQEEIAHRSITVEAWTRENLIVYEETSERQFRFGMPGAPLKEQEWKRCIEELRNIDPKPDYLVASGSLPPGVPDDFYAQVAGLARDFGAKIVVDTSAEPLRLAVKQSVFLIKPNLRELNELAGRKLEEESEQEEVARRIVDSGQSEAVVISRGAGGALAVWKGGHEHLRAPTVPIKSKVGAGDSMLAGIVLGLAQGNPLPEAVRFGVAAGAAAVMTPGTELCRREDAERIYAKMRATEESSHRGS